MKAILLDEAKKWLEENCENQYTRMAVFGIMQSMPTVDYQKTPNEPLTLEQLLEMDGEPVYDAKDKKWHVIEIVGNCFVEMTDGAIFDSDIWCNNLTDRLYRRPPEGEEDN